MNDLILFAFGDNLVRLYRDENGNPWWVAKDVCSVLELDNVTEALRGLDDDEKITISNPEGNPRAGIPHALNFINEPGLYSLTLRSRKPEAREFKRWVTHEVLPALRKTGFYIHPRRMAKTLEPLALDFESLPEDVRRLKPRTRERCMHLALQSARLAGLGSPAEQLAFFIEFCRMLGQPAEAVAPGLKHIHRYIETQLVHRPGARLQADRVYRHFTGWWRANVPGEQLPARNRFGGLLGSVYRRFKSNSWFYSEVAFRSAD